MADHSERTAKLVAAFVTFGCVCFFALVGRPETQPLRQVNSLPAPTPRPSLEPPPPRIDPNEEFLAVPGRWASVDFKNHHYAYRFSDGSKDSFTLKDGEYRYTEGLGGTWYSLADVYYVDVTGDLIPDAIVDVERVSCGGSCDGGVRLLFIYSNSKGKLKELFRYATGTYGYGCGLKSVTLERKKVSLELFGRCPRPGMDDPGLAGKYLPKDLTQLTFLFRNGRFIRTKIKYVSTGVIRVKGQLPVDFRINPEPANVSRP